MAPDVFVRRARPQDAVAISRLNNSFANEGLMLLRTPEMISLAIDDYVVVQGPSGEILACGALKEYSPSVDGMSRFWNQPHGLSREEHANVGVSGGNLIGSDFGNPAATPDGISPLELIKAYSNKSRQQT